MILLKNLKKIRYRIFQLRHAVYMKSKTELDETITSIKECITAMKEGMEGGFLQAKMPRCCGPTGAEGSPRKHVPRSISAASGPLQTKNLGHSLW